MRGVHYACAFVTHANTRRKPQKAGSFIDTLNTAFATATLGLRITTLRTLRGMSRKGLASAAGISYPYISEVETDAKVPSVEVLDRIRAALDTTFGELLD